MGLLPEVLVTRFSCGGWLFFLKCLQSFSTAGQITRSAARLTVSRIVLTLQPRVEMGSRGCFSSTFPLTRKCQAEAGNRYFPVKTLQQLFIEITKRPSSERAFPSFKFTGLNFKISSGTYVSGSHYVHVTVDLLNIDQCSTIAWRDSCPNRNI